MFNIVSVNIVIISRPDIVHIPMIDINTPSIIVICLITGIVDTILLISIQLLFIINDVYFI